MATRSDVPFADTDDQASLRQLAREVAERDILPNARRWDENEEFPHESWDALRRADLLGITIGEQWGGAGLGDVEAAIVLEELARVDLSTAVMSQLFLNGPVRKIEVLGSDDLKAKWLPLAAAGEMFMAIGISEADAGVGVNHMRAKLTPDGDGFRLNAYKNYVTGGHKARGCLVWCRFPESEGGTNGIGAVIVDLESDGVSCVGTHENMGMRGMTEAELAFDDVQIERDDVIIWGTPNSDSFKALLRHFNQERVGNAAMVVGAAQGALEYATQYMTERKVGTKPIAGFQGLQWKVAEMAVRLEGARLLVQKALRLVDDEGTHPSLESAMAKAAASDAAKFVCDEAIQLLGGYGYSREYPVERIYRDMRGLILGAGTQEVLRNLIGRLIVEGEMPASEGWKPRRR